MGMAVALSVAWDAGGLDGSSVSPSVDADDHAPDRADLANGVFPADLHGLRRRLPDEWAVFLKHHFNGDVRRIRAYFDCDEKTARDWLHGKHGVNGAPLLMLVRESEAARAFFLGVTA